MHLVHNKNDNRCVYNLPPSEITTEHIQDLSRTNKRIHNEGNDEDITENNDIENVMKDYLITPPPKKRKKADDGN